MAGRSMASKSMGQLPAMQLAVEVWTSLGSRLATPCPVSSALPELLLGFGWIAFPSSSHGDWPLRRRLLSGVRGTSVSVGSRALVHDDSASFNRDIAQPRIIYSHGASRVALTGAWLCRFGRPLGRPLLLRSSSAGAYCLCHIDSAGQVVAACQCVCRRLLRCRFVVLDHASPLVCY
jgi:hypothetical protein